MNNNFKKNLGITLIFVVSGLQFFSYFGSVLVTPSLSKLSNGYANLEHNRPYPVDWVWVTVIGRITGAYILCNLTLRIGFFKVMRIMIFAYILIATLVSLYTFTDTLLYDDIKFMFLQRFLYSFFIPASFMLPALFFLKQRIKNPIMLSAYACLSVGLGTFLIFKYLAIRNFYDSWYHMIFYVSVVSGICYFFAENLLSKFIDYQPSFTTIKLPFSRLILASSFGGVCGATFSYHLAFIHSYVQEVLIGNNIQSISVTYYYALLISIIPVAKLVYAKSIFNPLKFSTLSVCLIAIIMANINEIGLKVYIAEQVIFGFLTAILLAPCHALYYQLFKDTQNYLNGMFWFVSFFTLFATTPHFFRKFFEIKEYAWLSIVYLLPVSLLFIVALNNYAKEIKVK